MSFFFRAMTDDSRLPDTLSCCYRLQVFQGNTALAEVYSTLVEDGQAGDTQALLAAASAAAGCSITLPRISHAPGFDKYRALGAGEAAHEAGYDAYMTGAVFACLLPLVAGKIAADSNCRLAVAHRTAIERAAAAAAARAARVANMTTPEAGALLLQQQQQQTPPMPPLLQQPQPALQVQQQQLAEQQTPQVQQQQLLLLPGSLLQYVQGVAGRLNITFSDIPYAALSEDDPIPERPCTFHLSGLQPGYRADDVWRMLQRQGLGSVSDKLDADFKEDLCLYLGLMLLLSMLIPIIVKVVTSAHLTGLHHLSW
jgi:poly(A)-specific ribonuclease